MKEEHIKTKPKKGKIFFLTLIILSGIAVFSLLFLAFEGDRVTSYTIEKFVLSRDLLEKEFSQEVTPEERKRVVSDLHLFFESARLGVESKERVASIGGKLREMMEDHKITREEVQELENLLNKK
jgi:polyhydroxyalkanoate synthesis regulator phasin